MSEFVQIARYADQTEAIIARGLLQSNGIEVLAPELYTLGADPGLIYALGGCRLMVREDDVDVARNLLRTIAGSPDH